MLKVILAAVLLVPLSTFAGEKDWLVGNWLLNSPNNESQEVLTFKGDGIVHSTEGESGTKSNGFYFLTDDAVKATIIHQGGRSQVVELTFDENKNKLFVKSGDSISSHYRKLPRE